MIGIDVVDTIEFVGDNKVVLLAVLILDNDDDNDKELFIDVEVFDVIVSPVAVIKVELSIIVNVVLIDEDVSTLSGGGLPSHRFTSLQSHGGAHGQKQLLSGGAPYTEL